MINYAQYRLQIEKLYEDTFSVERPTKVKDPITKQTNLVKMMVITEQPCKLSQTTTPKDGQTEAQNNISYNSKLFCAPELDIRQGDIVIVTRKAGNRVYEFHAGEPFPPYQSHQEIGLQRKEWA